MKSHAHQIGRLAAGLGIFCLAGITIAGCADLKSAAAGATGASGADSQASHEKAAAEANEVQKKYYTFENQAGGTKCVPQGKLAELKGEPYKCYMDLDECGASVDAVRGKLDAEFNTMLADMLKFEQEGAGKDPEFMYACPGDGPEFVHGLAIQGLGYARSSEHLDSIVALTEPEVVAELGHNDRVLLTEAIRRIQDRERGVPAMKNLLEADGHTKTFKTLIVQYLGRWNSDAGVDFCTEALKSESDDYLLRSCVRYLGHQQATDAYPLIVRNMENYTEDAMRAFGHMGDKQAVEVIEGYLDDESLPRLRLPALAALVNLGVTKHWNEIEQYIDGKKKKSDDDFSDYKLSWRASMETTSITNPNVAPKVEKALKKAAQEEDDKEWQIHTYANVALAQRGDAEAVVKLAEALESPKENVRKAVLDAIGGRDDVPHTNWLNRGVGVVADESLVEPLMKFHEMESDERLKAKVLHAVASIRAMSAAQGGAVAQE